MSWTLVVKTMMWSLFLSRWKILHDTAVICWIAWNFSTPKNNFLVIRIIHNEQPFPGSHAAQVLPDKVEVTLIVDVMIGLFSL